LEGWGGQDELVLNKGEGLVEWEDREVGGEVGLAGEGVESKTTINKNRVRWMPKWVK